MSDVPSDPDQSRPTTEPSWTPLPVISGRLGIVVTKVHQLVRDRSLLAVRRDGILMIPGEFVDPESTTGVLKGLPGTITLLTDAGYTDEEIIDWLYTVDDTLPGSPIQALLENRGREVHRRAQTAGF